MRKEFKLTADEVQSLRDISTPSPYIVAGGVPPVGIQDRANKAWKELALKYGFIWDSVEGSDKGDAYFTAEVSEARQIANTIRSGSKVHDLKAWPEVFAPVRSRLKRHEIRIFDRDFQVGDWLNLKEWNPATKEYTGQQELRRITYITPPGTWGLPENVGVLSLATREEIA